MSSEITDQFAVNSTNIYKCCPDIRCRGFTDSMRLVLSTRKYPGLLNQLKDILNDHIADTNEYGWTLLHLACCNSATASTIETVQLLLSSGININAQTTSGDTALHYVISHASVTSDTNVIRLLVDSNADVNIKNKYEQTALHMICNKLQFANGEIPDIYNIVKLLLDAGADINSFDIDGWNALHYVASWSDIPLSTSVMKLLIDNNINVNTISKNKKSVISIAINICLSNTDIINQLLDNGANINHTDAKGNTIMHCILRKINDPINDPINNEIDTQQIIDIIKKIISLGFNINSVGKYNQSIMFYVAILSNKRISVDIAKILINAGIDLNIRNNKRDSVLEYAINYDNPELAKLLIESGADIKSNSSLVFECFNVNRINCVSIFQLLVDNSDINIQDKNGNTPLHYASMHTIDIVSILIKNGANVNIKNKLGETALHVACKKSDNGEIVKFLVENGADIDVLNNSGHTPLYIAHKHINQSDSMSTFNTMINLGANISLVQGYTKSNLLKYIMYNRITHVKKCDKKYRHQPY